jgi:hypothetical protein
LGKRGPKPRQLAKLFQLKYLEGINDQYVLADKLDVKLETVNRYERRLKRKLIRKLGHVSPERLHFVCPECLEAKMFEDHETGERVCRNCGLVVERAPTFSVNLPFDTTYALTSNIAFGKSLGNTIRPKELYKVIAKGPSGRKDLPIRATQIQVITSAVDPPKVRSILSYGSKLLRDLGLDRDTDFNHVFADRYGRLLRLSASIIEVSKLKLQPYLMARAILYQMLQKTDEKKARELLERHRPPAKYVAIANILSIAESIARS